MCCVFYIDLKVVKMFVIVMGVFFVCWLFYIISLLVLNFCVICIFGKIVEVVKWLYYFNLVVNLIIYILFNWYFWVVFWRIFCWYVLGWRFLYFGWLLLYSMLRSISWSSVNIVVDLDKVNFKSEVEILVCIEVVIVV